MSTLDQAFRKAYQKSGAQPARGVHPIVPPPHIHLEPTDLAPVVIPPQPSPAKAPKLRPVFEVPQFTWPSAVETVLDLAATGLSEFTKLLKSDDSLTSLVIVVCGLGSGVGTTTACLSLARRLAAQYEVALVDGNFARPQLGNSLGLAPQTGWEDVLADRQPLAEALIESALDRLTLLPICQASEALALTRQMSATLAAMASRYDVICVDAGPANQKMARAWTACLQLAGLARRWLLVTDARSPDRDAIGLATLDLSAAGVAECELVENYVAV